MSTPPAPARWRRLRRALLGSFGLMLTTATLGLAVPGCSVGYVMRSAWFQAELLASRQPIDKVRARGTLNSTQLAALDQVADVKAFGEQLGFQPTRNYESVAVDWNRTIWNVTACAPLAFEPRTWWFPIVGRVPYLGYFREEDARRSIERLGREGLDTSMRTAGAYSTLGWFRDPILMPMLGWSRFDLADTVLHELAHATLWIPGSVSFNESFANFVGEEAAFRYIADRDGPDSDTLRAAHEDFEDLTRWREVQIALYKDLDALYQDASLSDEEKSTRKAALFGAFPDRVAAAGFHNTPRFVAAARRGDWNNARLVGFKTYNFNRGWFEAILARNDGDLLKFMADIKEIARSDKDPFAALSRAAGGP